MFLQVCAERARCIYVSRETLMLMMPPYVLLVPCRLKTTAKNNAHSIRCYEQRIYGVFVSRETIWKLISPYVSLSFWGLVATL